MRYPRSVLAFVLCISACSRWPRLDNVWKDTIDWDEAFRSSPLIAIGRVLSVREAPAARPNAWHLAKATIDIEDVLQGQARAGAVDFYFHVGPRTGDWNSLQPRERYVFFLTRDRGVLRAAWDQWRSAIPMASGIHRSLPLSPGRPLVERVSVMLLTPGGGVNPARFVDGFARSVPFALSHLGRWRTAKLLKQLTADQRPEIRLGACEELTARYWGQDACWNEMDGSETGGVPAVAGTKASRAAERDQRARTADADHWWKQMSAGNPPGELLDELRLLTAHKNPGIRARYCRFLRSHYPGETDCGCESPALPGGVGQALAEVNQKLRGPSVTISSTRMVSFTTNGSPYFTPARFP